MFRLVALDVGLIPLPVLAHSDGGQADVLPEAGRGRAEHRGQTRDPVKVGGRME